jgi:hypothetical protein
MEGPPADIGKNSFHVGGLDRGGTIVPRLWVMRRLPKANSSWSSEAASVRDDRV